MINLRIPTSARCRGLTVRRRGVRMLDENIPYVIAEYKIICRTRKIVDYDFVFMLSYFILPITPSLICKIAVIMRAKAVKTSDPV